MCYDDTYIYIYTHIYIYMYMDGSVIFGGIPFVVLEQCWPRAKHTPKHSPEAYSCVIPIVWMKLAVNERQDRRNAAKGCRNIPVT